MPFTQLIDVVKGLTYMHELHVVHGSLKGVSNRLIRPVTCNTIAPAAKYLHQSGWSCLSRGFWTLYGRWCGHTSGSLGPRSLRCQSRAEDNFHGNTCFLDEPGAYRLGLQTDQGVGCLRFGDGYLRGSYIRIYATMMISSKSGIGAGCVWSHSLQLSQLGQGCHRGPGWDTPRKTRGRGVSWIHS